MTKLEALASYARFLNELEVTGMAGKTEKFTVVISTAIEEYHQYEDEFKQNLMTGLKINNLNYYYQLGNVEFVIKPPTYFNYNKLLGAQVQYHGSKCRVVNVPNRYVNHFTLMPYKMNDDIGAGPGNNVIIFPMQFQMEVKVEVITNSDAL